MDEKLNSWKEIARYLDREVRTVQRWAASRSLPVHHLPGGGRPRVFSLKSEIDAWLRLKSPGDREDSASIAVLPFVNLGSGEENKYFGDGLAEEVINALVRIPGLRVSARTSSFSFSGRQQDVREIGAQLGTSWLLEGSVRRERRRIRVAAQLIKTEDGFHAWSECYDRRVTDVFDIQEEIARSIAAALKLKLGQPQLSPRSTEDMTAYDLWIRGRSFSYQYTREAFAQARACYEAALKRDPAFARPYFGLAELLFYGVQFGLAPQPEVLHRLRAAIAKSLDLDDQSGDAHALMGICRGLLDYDWPGAATSFQRALELSPGSALVLIQHAWYHLVPRMRVPEALHQARQSVELDPLSPISRGLLGLVHVVARQSERAVEECRRAVELAPGLWWLRWFYGTALLQHGELAHGIREFRIAYEKIHQPLVIGGMALIYGLCQRRKKAEQMFAELQELSRREYVPPAAFAFAYLGLGDERVFVWLDKAIDARDPVATHLPSMPLYDSIRDDPRFAALLAKMHLDQA